MLEGVGGMPLLDADARLDFDLTTLIASLQTTYLESGFSLFVVGLLPDRTNTSRFSIYVSFGPFFGFSAHFRS